MDRLSFMEKYLRRKSSVLTPDNTKNNYINEKPYARQSVEPVKHKYRNESVLSATSDVNLIQKSLEKQAVNNTKRNKIIAVVVAIIIALLLAGLITFCILYFIMLRNPGYKEACDSSKLCISGKNLTCNGTCICDPTTSYWNGISCVSVLAFGSTCLGGSFQCMPSLSCKNQLCQCDNTTYYNGTRCVPKVSYGASCSLCNTTCSSCDNCTQCREYENLYCDTVNSKCYCNLLTHYYDPLAGCVLKYSFNQYCTSNQMCQDLTNNLFCRLPSTVAGTSCPLLPLWNYCNCPSNMYFNGSTCKPFEKYYGSCPNTCECDGSVGLYCDTSDYKCNCPLNFYWSGSNCIPQKAYLSACGNDNECYGSKGLTCVSGSCQCNLYNGNWYWSSFLQECLECPSDWHILSYSNEQRCLRVSFDKQSWNNAMINCDYNGARLITINNTFFSSTLKVSGMLTQSIGQYWVAATDERVEGTFVWTYTGELVGNSILTQCNNNGGYSENCFVVDSSTWCLLDAPCENGYFYVCQKTY